MEALFFCGVPIGCVMTYGLVLDSKRRTRDLERHRAGWSGYAGDRGLRYSTAGYRFSLRVDHRIEGSVDGVPVLCSTDLSILSMPTTTIAARAAVPIDGRLYVSCAEVFSQAQEDLRAKRVELPDADFNGGTFFVHATDPSLVDAVLLPHVRALLMRMSEAGRQSLNFRCDRDTVVVAWRGHDPLPDLLDLGKRLLVATCRARTSVAAYR